MRVNLSRLAIVWWLHQLRTSLSGILRSVPSALPSISPYPAAMGIPAFADFYIGSMPLYMVNLSTTVTVLLICRILLLTLACSRYAYLGSCILHRLVIFTLALPHTDPVHVFHFLFAMPINRSLWFGLVVASECAFACFGLHLICLICTYTLGSFGFYW